MQQTRLGENARKGQQIRNRNQAREQKGSREQKNRLIPRRPELDIQQVSRHQIPEHNPGNKMGRNGRTSGSGMST